MEIEVDWDLHAVVRGCYTTNNNLKNQQQQQPPHVEKVDQNHDKLFRHESMLNLDSFTTSTTTSVVTLAPPSPPPPPPQHQPPELFDQLFRPFLISPLFTPTTESSRNRHLEPSISASNLLHPRNTTTASRSKRRKNQFKKVCEVPAAGLATDDKWSWRKYGQKPIKGSPYPRGYYRCSSSKGCPARKQVERSKTDPNKFIITYTSEHNHPAPTHRNSLAGISRHHQNSNKLNVLQSSKPGTSSSSVPTSPSDDDDDEMQQSVKTEVTQYELDEILCHEEEDDEKEVLLDDDFFDGLDEMNLPLGHQIAPI